MVMTTIDHLKPITASILQQKEELAESNPLESNEKNQLLNELVPWRLRLIEVYAQSIIQVEEDSIQALEKWGQEVSGKLASLMLPLDIALEEISFYRESIGELIKEECKKQEFSLDEFYMIITKFSNVVDYAVKLVSQSYMEDFKDTILNAQFAVDELSVPLVRVTEGIGIIPIVGEIDTKRAQVLMDNSLSKGNEFELNTIIIELSGVSIIDTMVAHQIFKVIEALKLTGIHAILSGIRPDIVQSMVSLGIDMKHIETFSSLHQSINKISPHLGE
ncbi:STAS domain-containing protein [Halobacillus sp. A5]|uniref:STAS domain-containing protein n=1 Tax=Halobacillus sp. A5 TaxID=2880263 RepID=UPI0020A65900|nr:STAS domain-containing protein [Halobacillus sp. A5]MCP3027738.1 STAS domain-containing protein [Halobacillus sp. A5]